MNETMTIGGKEFRVECNMNALMDFLQERGTDDFSAIADVTKLKPSDMLPLMAACIREGERLEGRKCDLTSKDIGAVADFSTLGSFIAIFNRAMAPAVTVEEKK